MKIKIQESDMLASARKIDSQIDKLERMQRELQNMLNSTNWDMRARRPMESQLSDARKLNKELTTITKNMSDMVKKTTDSMKQRDIELGNSINNTSVSTSNSNLQDEIDGGFTFFKGDADFTIFEDEFNILKPKVDVGLEGSIASFDENISFGDSVISAGAGIDLDAGRIEAGGKIEIDPSTGDLGAEGQIGAYVGKGEISGEINIGPIILGASGGLSFGAGIGGNIGFDDGKFGIGGEIAWGPGVSFDLTVGIDFGWIKDTYDTLF